MFDQVKTSSAVRLRLPYSEEDAHTKPLLRSANEAARTELAHNLCARFVEQHPESCQSALSKHEVWDGQKMRRAPATIVIRSDFLKFLAAESTAAIAKFRGEDEE